MWEAVLDHVAEEGPVRRERVIERFRHDDQRAVIAVLTDLVGNGLLYASGRGEGTVYRATTEADRVELSSEEGDEAFAILLWGMVFRRDGITLSQVFSSMRADEGRIRAALDRLLADGRVNREGPSDDAPLHAPTFLIPAGAPVGWEAAVFDHYQAVATAIAAKTRKRAAGAPDNGRVGGSTIHFGIHPGHPFEDRVLGILDFVRTQLNALWNEVAAYNREHPLADDAATRVTFYFGQHVRTPDETEPGMSDPEQSEEGTETP